MSALVQGVKQGHEVDLNAVKKEVWIHAKGASLLLASSAQLPEALHRQATLKYALDKPPKLVEIIAAVPEEHRQTLLPQ